MPQARGSSAGVWGQPGVCVGRSVGCLSIPEHPRTTPLSRAESSAPGKPAQPERGISSQRLHPGQAFPQKSILPRADSFHLGLAPPGCSDPKGFSLQWPCRAIPSSSLSEPGSAAGHDPCMELAITLPIPLLPGRAGPRNMPTKSEATCQIRPQDCLPLSLPSTCALCPALTLLQCHAQCEGSPLQI